MAYWDADDYTFESTTTVYINDEEKSILLDSLQIQLSVANRATCNFQMIVANKNELKLGNNIDIHSYTNEDNEVYLFSGKITNVNIKPITIGGSLVANVNCTDYNQILDRELVAEEYENKSIYYIVNDIYQKYLIDEWVAIYNYPSSDIIIEKAVFSYISISDCFKYLCDETGYNYTVSSDGWINFFYRDDIVTENIEKSHIFDIDLNMNLDDYRNRQFIKGGYDEATVTNEVVTPAPDGNTTTFFCRYPIGRVPTVKVNGTTVSSSSVGIDGISDDMWFLWNKGVNKLSQNTEMLATLTSGTISIDYKGLVKIMVQADNVDGQTELSENETTESIYGSGIYADIQEVGSIQTRNEAINYANGLLYKYNKIPESVRLKTWVHREIGRTVFINYEGLTDDTLYFIESKTIYFETGRLREDYNLLNGESLGNWTEFFRKIYKQGQDMLINEDVQLIKLQRQSESWDICSQSDIETFTPNYLSNNNYLSEFNTLGTAVNGKQYYPVFLSDDLYLSDTNPIGIIIDTGIVIKDT